MKPTLLAQPYANQVSVILKQFESGKPLSCDQLNFLSRHEKVLSHHALDQAIKYYLKSYREKQNAALSLTFPKQRLNELSVHKIKYIVQEMLRNNLSHVDVKMTMEQFLQFKAVGISELIFWHGNHFLTGAPFYPGGIPHVVYFQWGNLFGIVKLYIFPEEKLIQGNVLIDFERMNERSLNQCVMDYTKKIEHELMENDHAIHELASEIVPTQAHSVYDIPSLKPVFYEIGMEAKK